MPDAEGAAGLLNALHQVGAKEALAKLARQAADEASLASPDSAAELLKVLAKAGMPELAAAVAMRAAEQATLDRGSDVDQLLTALNQPGTRQAFITLANRAADAGQLSTGLSDSAWQTSSRSAVSLTEQLRDLGDGQTYRTVINIGHNSRRNL